MRSGAQVVRRPGAEALKSSRARSLNWHVDLWDASAPRRLSAPIESLSASAPQRPSATALQRFSASALQLHMESQANWGPERSSASATQRPRVGIFANTATISPQDEGQRSRIPQAAPDCAY